MSSITRQGLHDNTRLPSAPEPVRLESQSAKPTPPPRIRVPDVFPRTDSSVRVSPASQRACPAGGRRDQNKAGRRRQETHEGITSS